MLIFCQYFTLEVLWEFLVDLEVAVDQLVIHGATLEQWRGMLCP